MNVLVGETTLGGWVVTTSFVAAAGLTVMEFVGALVRPPLVTWSVYVPDLLSVWLVANVATPLLGVAVRVPPSVAPAGLLASESVTVLATPLKLVAVLPKRSCAVTTMAGP